MRNTADVTGGKPIAVLLQFISGVCAINPLVAFYDIHGGKREVLFFYFVPDATRESSYMCANKCKYINEPASGLARDLRTHLDTQAKIGVKRHPFLIKD
jgi:hypothetical protein